LSDEQFDNLQFPCFDNKAAQSPIDSRETPGAREMDCYISRFEQDFERYQNQKDPDIARNCCKVNWQPDDQQNRMSKENAMIGGETSSA
jgi:hypothetical protein